MESWFNSYRRRVVTLPPPLSYLGMINLCVPPVHQVHPEVPVPALDKGDEALPLDPHQQGQAQACQEHGRYRVYSSQCIQDTVQ